MNRVGDETDIDRFATLFSPATPHASPTLPAISTSIPLPQSSHTHPNVKTPGSAASDFGPFVSVPTDEDPLASPSVLDAFPLDAPPSPQSAQKTLGTRKSKHATNPSLEFFDRFAERSRQAADRNKRTVLNELLLHEDDPLYFLSSHTDAAEPSPLTSDIPPLSEGLLIDLDNNEPDLQTRPNHLGRTENVTEPPLESPVDFLKFSDSPDLPRSPSLPLPTPSRLIPPITASPPQLQRSHSFISASPPLRPALDASTSLSSLGTLSSRFMSSLLSTRPPPSSSVKHRPSLDSLFSSSTPAPAAPHKHPTPVLPISHGTPFAAHPFVAPSGAPGFAGDRLWDKGFSADFDDGARVERRSVRLAGRREGTTALLTSTLADLLRQHLPALARLPRTWGLLYSLDQHGISLNTLYTACENGAAGTASGMLLVVRDSGDALFGAWIGEGIRRELGGYYGSGESFLWRFVGEKLQVYKWTGKNDYVALCETDYISFGGGDGHYGLYLDAALLDGSSARCPTFDNEPLCSRRAKDRSGTVAFECVGLEVWGVGT